MVGLKAGRSVEEARLARGLKYCALYFSYGIV
jgi:hypothetical protein